MEVIVALFMAFYQEFQETSLAVRTKLAELEARIVAIELTIPSIKRPTPDNPYGPPTPPPGYQGLDIHTLVPPTTPLKKENQ